MSDKEKYLNGITPAAEVAYAYLERPREGRTPRDKPRYTITLKMDPLDAEVLKFAKSIKDFTQGLKVPIKRDEETNWLMVTFHTMEKPPVVDSANTPLLVGVEVGSGSVARVQYSVTDYESTTVKGGIGGYTFYFNAVQVISLIKYQGGKSAVAFPVTEGYKVQGSTLASTASEGAADAPDMPDTQGEEQSAPSEDFLPF